MKRKLFARAMTPLAAALLFVATPLGAQVHDAPGDETPPFHRRSGDAPPPFHQGSEDTTPPFHRHADDAQPPAEPRSEEPRPAPRQEPERPARLPDFGPGTLRATQEAARRYADIAAAGGWPRVANRLEHNAQGKPVADLRRRLALEGYLPQDEGAADRWDDSLSDALRRFQANMGLDETGDLSRETLQALNVSAAARARQLAATAARLDRTKFDFGERYVVVNIPAASVEAVEGGDSVKRFTAIVGGKRDRSPQIVAQIVAIDINPAWTVPASIIRKELAPKLKRNPGYLARENIRIFDAQGREVDPAKMRRISNAGAAAYTFRQEPGPKNALGSIRISMPNKHAVFLHDTPRKELFDKDYRFLSHGCVRVEDVYDLAAWLLRDTGEWDAATLRDEVERGESREIRLSAPTPVAWVYMTGWATEGGPAHFRKDIYNLDKGTKLPPRDGGGVASR